MTTTEANIFLSIGTRFRKEREDLGYTQKGLATRLATTEQTIIAYEAGSTQPKISKLLLFQDIGADIMYILLGERRPANLKEPSTPAEDLAARVSELDMAEADAQMIWSLAKRLSQR